MKRLVVVGDSDIAFWPKEFLPSPTDDDEWQQPLVSGHSGATLSEVLPHLRSVLARTTRSNDDDDIKSCGNHGGGRATATTPDMLVVIACAGENDIGEGLSLERSVEALREFLDVVFRLDNDSVSCNSNLGSNRRKNGDDDRFLIFLGPKFEPWLEHDPSYKKKYGAMTRAFQRCLQEYGAENCDTNNDDEDINTDTKNSSTTITSDRIHFIDCLTMFCGETATLPGARLGGRAKADPRFFASDQLHLSKEGYEIWKDVVETKIRQCVSSSKSSSASAQK